MIRRDYILRMIEEFIQALARINSLKKAQRWDEAAEALDAGFQRLVGEGTEAVTRLSETELLAKLFGGEPTQVVRQKALMVAALLHQAGDVASAEDRAEGARACYLKALHLLLDALARGEVFEFPEFVPKVEVLLSSLRDAPLPVATQAELMQHYERIREFAKAEDALFAMLDAEPDHDAIVEFGIAFYQRLLMQSDTALDEASLPRAEVKEGLKELQRRRKRGV